MFSWVRITKDLLMDQGTPCIFKIMADLCQLLQVNHLKTLVYHPQTDSLIDRFDQMLKWVLRRVDKDRPNCDLLLPHVLFVV